MKRFPEDETFMRRALKLAERGAGRVSPNPLVGCVIVKNGRVIAEGYHARFGGDHAEVAALKKLGFRANGATMYVNLEPCAHQGKTPPCLGAVIRSGIRRVVIALRDPHALTNGRSVRELRRAGVKVTEGIREDEARALNRFFFKHVTTGLPYVIAKAGLSLDGMIAARRGNSTRITGSRALRHVHALRARVDAVLVGAGTARSDEPRLNVRAVRGRNPARVVLDPDLRLPLSNRMFRSRGGRLILFCADDAPLTRRLRREKAGISAFPVRRKAEGLDLRHVLRRLGRMGIASVLVEGGAKIFASFARSRLADEWQFIIAPCMIGGKGLPVFDGSGGHRFVVKATRPLGGDALVIAGRGSRNRVSGGTLHFIRFAGNARAFSNSPPCRRDQ